MSLFQSLRQFANRQGYDFCRVGKNRLGRILELDLLTLTNADGDIFDVGANTGRAARLISQLFPQARIWSFEPCKASFDELCNSPGLSHVKAFHCAVGAADGEAVLNKFNGSELNSILQRTENADQFIDPVSIEKSGLENIKVRKLDSLAKEHHIKKISFLKIDTQGFDLEVLKGASEFLAAGKIGTIQIEVNFAPLYGGQPTFSDILNYLATHHYSLVGLYEEIRGENGCIKWCDALFKRDHS